MRRRAGGFTLLESLVAASIFLLALGCLLSIFRMGALIWLRSDASAELLGRLQTASAKIGREAEAGLFDSLALAQTSSGPTQTGCAFLTARDSEGRFQYDPGTCLPEWQTTVVFYFDQSSGRLFRRMIGLGGATIHQNLELHIDGFVTPSDSTDPPKLLKAYSSGTQIAANLEEVRFEAPTRTPTHSGVSLAARELVVEITARKSRYGPFTPERLASRTVFRFRN